MIIRFMAARFFKRFEFTQVSPYKFLYVTFQVCPPRAASAGSSYEVCTMHHDDNIPAGQNFEKQAAGLAAAAGTSGAAPAAFHKTFTVQPLFLQGSTK
ncbi:hypothetical protein ACFOLF_26720 [Paenibacillus sepulcri]|uniref:Uncharacterized protein n=1 Tax=Paenibacillus sepulcri TaxID=359917 RepID=A0ABS7CD65_9BACL|nr:hypothetical protein [Paenibacillus sepulcri]